MRLENEQQLQKLTLKFIHQYRRSGGANACSDVHSKCNPTHDFPLQRSLTNMSHRPGLTTLACLDLPLNYFSQFREPDVTNVTHSTCEQETQASQRRDFLLGMQEEEGKMCFVEER
jgi:hypothetical protein